MTSVTEGQIPDPVGIELVSRVEVGNGAPEIGRERIDDLAVEGEATDSKPFTRSAFEPTSMDFE